MTDAVTTRRAASAGIGASRQLGAGWRRAGLLARHRAAFEGVALLIPIALVGLTHVDDLALWVIAAGYLGLNAIFAARAGARPGDGAATRWTAARVIAAVLMVAAGQFTTGTTGLLSVVYLPIIAMSAFAGPRILVLAVGASVLAHWGVETSDRGVPIEALQRTLGFAAAAALVAAGTRHEVARMHRARARLRRAMVGDRRRSRQIAGVEAIGRILAERGPTREALDEVVGRIESGFGYRYVSLYLGHERGVELGAQRGYANLVERFDGSRGIVARVMRTHRPEFVADVEADPDYWSVNPDVRSEICVPLLADGEFLGFVNVESVAEPLDTTDLRVMVAVADRLAAALMIGRERQRLADRAELFHHLHDFSEAVNGTLEPDELYRAVVGSVSAVVRGDVVALHVRDRASGRYPLVASVGADEMPIRDARPGKGLAGRAIRERTMIVDDAPGGVAGSGAAMLAAAVPLVRDRAVVGVLTLMRRDPTARFSDLERGALSMLGEQAALAVTNVLLHAEVAELALRDPLTGLFNRRYLDPALEQLVARRHRTPPSNRVPLAAIMFDLDSFSDLNNRHGHQVGDAVLRAFGRVLRARTRATDIVARYGGEEFVAVLFRAGLDDAVRVADEVREQLAATPIPTMDGGVVTATVSAGCAALSADDDSDTDILRAADVALSMAKQAGRDRVCAA